MDRTDEPTPQSSYDSLINDGIDELNASESFAGTSLAREEVEQKAKSPVFESWWFKILCASCALSVGLFFYYQHTGKKELSLEEANQELREVFGEDFEELNALLGEEEVPAFAGPSDPNFIAWANGINRSLEKTDGESSNTFPVDGYTFVGNGFSGSENKELFHEYEIDYDPLSV